MFHGRIRHAINTLRCHASFATRIWHATCFWSSSTNRHGVDSHDPGRYVSPSKEKGPGSDTRAADSSREAALPRTTRRESEESTRYRPPVWRNSLMKKLAHRAFLVAAVLGIAALAVPKSAEAGVGISITAGYPGSYGYSSGFHPGYHGYHGRPFYRSPRSYGAYYAPSRGYPYQQQPYYRPAVPYRGGYGCY